MVVATEAKVAVWAAMASPNSPVVVHGPALWAEEEEEAKLVL